jgi:hypothetical protein
VSDRRTLRRLSRLRGVELPIALFNAASPLLPGQGGADMVWASALACDGDLLLRLPVCQGKDLVVEAQRATRAASRFCSPSGPAFTRSSRTAVVRTRMPGGGGGVASRGAPLSRSSARSSQSCPDRDSAGVAPIQTFARSWEPAPDGKTSQSSEAYPVEASPLPYIGDDGR